MADFKKEEAKVDAPRAKSEDPALAAAKQAEADVKSKADPNADPNVL